MQRFPIPTPTWAEYKQNQEYFDRLYQGLRGSWYNYNTAVPGFVELPGHCMPQLPAVNQASSSQAAPNPNSTTMHCDKHLGKDCNNACCKPKPKPKPSARGRRVTIATASDEENGVVTDTEGNITDSSKPVVKGKMTTNAKGKEKAVQTESENESSVAQADDDASTDAETSVLSSVACLKDPKWSLSEDCRLRSMKEAGETWAFISSSLCKTKDDVRARWKILQSQLRPKETVDTDTDNAAEEESVDDSTDEDGENNEESDADDEVSDNDEDSDADDEDSEDSDDDEESDEDDNDSDDDDEESDESDEDSDVDTNKISKSTVNNKWHTGVRNLKVARENQGAKARARAKASGREGSSAGEANENDGYSSLSRGDAKQMKHMKEHVYGAMYPPHFHPQSNAYLVKRDCALLATIDSKYKRSRWLEMQANFYNVTGQMVPLVSFKARCERAEAEKTERSKTRELEKRMNKVEDWIAKQEREQSADSEDADESEDSDDSEDAEDSDDSDE
ncbi:uncharacterized protein FSUBG_5664 [Fusarium subglutinans]|uniref:Myb-like domain-containing protein n=1 Tax=Gibberella subglutinans TaxID=42677 RepID=A0A8H5V2C7_GIBSU|nr:uncharacterized protein FSUBG_5664 [Fusarium subglutinans]KAF5606828.1 hypothetical protein FSUBG_5664 [Fusarium subglutinans]